MSNKNRGKPAPGGRTIQSVDRAVAILESLATAKEGLALSELAKSVRLAPQTLQSLLCTLQKHRWAVQSGHRGAYRLGPRLGEVHRVWRKGQDRIALARPIVTELSRQLGEYVILAEWAGGSLMPLIETNPDRELAVRGELFLPDRIHTTATGKVLLSLLDEPLRRQIVKTLPLVRRGPRSVTKQKTFLDQLDSIRKAGVAVCVEEAAEAVVAIAVSVSTASGQGLAAMGVSLPLARYSTSRSGKLIAELRDGAKAITEAWA